MGPSPFLDTIVKPEVNGGLSITVYRKPTHTDQYLQWDSHTTSLPNLVLSTPSPIGLKLWAAILSCSKKKKSTSGKLSPNVNILNGLWTRWRKGSICLPVRPLMGPLARVPQVPLLSPMKLGVRAILSYPTHMVFVKVSKRSVVGMASKLTSKVAPPSRTSWSPQRTKTLWSTKVMPFMVSVWRHWLL